MERISGLLIFVLLFTSIPQAQDPLQTTASFKSRSELVLIPTIVTDHGTTVRGLTKNDFVLLHDGKSEQVAVFEEIEATPAQIEQPTLPPNTVQNFATADAHQDVVILLLDFLNGSWSTAARIRAYLKDLAIQLEATKTPTSVLLLSNKGLVQVHSFTTDMSGFVTAVQHWAEGAGVTPISTLTGWSDPLSKTTDLEATSMLHQMALNPGFIDQVKLDKSAMTLQALEQLAQSYRGIPGRKKLVWMSTGFPMGLERDTRTPNSFVKGEMIEFKIQDKAMQAWRALSSANIAVYPIDTNGVANPTWEERYSAAIDPRTVNKLPPANSELPTNVSSLLDVAARTGGKTCTEFPTTCLTKAVADAPHYYILGFYLHGDAKPGWHKLKVKVDRPDVGVRSRDGFLVGAAQPVPKQAEKDDVVLTALASPLDYTSVPLRLHWSLLPASAKDRGLEFILSSPPGAIGISDGEHSVSLDMLAYVRPVGKDAGESYPVTISKKLSEGEQSRLTRLGFQFKKAIPVAAGRYEIRFFLRDNVSSKIGTVSTVVEVPK